MNGRQSGKTYPHVAPKLADASSLFNQRRLHGHSGNFGNIGFLAAPDGNNPGLLFAHGIRCDCAGARCQSLMDELI